MNRLGSLLLVLSLSTAPAFAQQLEREPPPAGEPKAEPYLPAEPVDYRVVLGPPPRVGSIEDDADRFSIEVWQKSATAARREAATLDERFVYSRFDEAFGHAIDRKTLPTLVRVLNRAMRDAGAAAFPAKDHFHRPRPFQRMKLQYACGNEPPPKPEANPTHGTSYPSGHSVGGWTVAMILARVAPERAEAVMSRAAEYAESRLICGRHFPSDLEAGHTIAAAVIARLDALPEFRKDIAEARAELEKSGT
jgi:acid phosphatase (class A)